MIEIKHKKTGEILHTVDADDLAGADLRRADLTGAYLTDADLRDADLTGAYLRGAILGGADLRRSILRGAILGGADLEDADLRRADLEGAILTGAILTGADLTGADLGGADLTGADLGGADLGGAILGGAICPEVPYVKNLDQKILERLELGKGELDMGVWHGCETTHCRAGWAITLAGSKGLALEKMFGSGTAGALLYAKAYPDLPIPNFFASNEVAMEDMRNRAGRIVK